MIADTHEIQRLSFVPGQDLLARDFRDAVTFDARLRHWHNRALHAIYGVSFGLHAEPSAEATAVRIEPGLAYDAAGREILLRAARTVPFPTSFDVPLLLALRHDGEGAVELAWTAEEQLRPCDEVPVARIVTDKGLPFDPGFLPPAARPLARPHLGYGSTAKGATAWQAETLELFSPVLSLFIEVDTRAAGFTRVPCYFAWLQGGLLDPVRSSETVKLYVSLYPSLEQEKPTGFVLRVLLRPPVLPSPPPDPLPSGFDPRDPRRWALATAQQTLSLCWLGIEGPSATMQSSSEVSHGNP